MSREYKKFKAQCPKCDEVSTSKEWNDQTELEYISDITTIEEAYAHNEMEHHYFVCPVCKEEIEGEDIITIWRDK